MFVAKKISLKAITICAAAALFIAFALIRLFVCSADTPSYTVGEPGKYSLSAEGQSAQVKFLGGDISSTSLGGFMHGFARESLKEEEK